MRQAVERGLLNSSEPLKVEEFVPLRSRQDFIELFKKLRDMATSPERLSEIWVCGQITFNVCVLSADLEDETGWNPSALFILSPVAGSRICWSSPFLGAWALACFWPGYPLGVKFRTLPPLPPSTGVPSAQQAAGSVATASVTVDSPIIRPVRAIGAPAEPAGSPGVPGRKSPAVARSARARPAGGDRALF